MEALVENSKQGYSAKQPKGGNTGGSYNPVQQKFKNIAEDLKQSGFTDEQIAEHIDKLTKENQFKFGIGSTSGQQSENTTGGYTGGLQIK